MDIFGRFKSFDPEHDRACVVTADLAQGVAPLGSVVGGSGFMRTRILFSRTGLAADSAVAELVKRYPGTKVDVAAITPEGVVLLLSSRGDDGPGIEELTAAGSAYADIADELFGSPIFSRPVDAYVVPDGEEYAKRRKKLERMPG